MKGRNHMKTMLVILLLGSIFCTDNHQTKEPVNQENSLMRVAQTITMPDVSGRIDHLAVDLKGQRIFVAALGNNSVEVIDLKTGKVIHTIKGLHEPQGVVFIPETDRLYVTNGEGGDCTVYDASALKVIHTIPFSGDADNVRYDSAAKQLLVGFANGALGIVDVTNNEKKAEIKLAGHPESFQLESGGRRVFINIPDARQVAVVDRDKKAVIAQWQIKDASANFPMALDEANHRLFIGCRNPARMLVIDTDNGKEIARLDMVGDADDIFYDRQRKRIYIAGGEGFISVISQQDANRYQSLAKIATAAGARTCLFIPEWNRIYLAVPHRGSQQAEIRVYEF
jgi:YVTN family beta-propeller protein